MAKCLMPPSSGGGADLEVIRVDSYAAIPASGTNGKLYVITALDIPSDPNGVIWWAGNLPTTRADGAVLQNNDVTIMGGMSSQTPVQVLPGYYIFPRAAYQRVSGAWVQKIAWMRYNGNLVQLGYYLYKDGDEPAGAWLHYDSAAEVTNVVTATCSSTSPYGANALGVKIDLTDVRTIRILHKLSGVGTSGNRFVVCNAIGSTVAMYNSVVAYVTLPSNSLWQETLFDVSALVGQYYIGQVSNYYIGNSNKGSQLAQVLFE